jgi:hypothetical protein
MKTSLLVSAFLAGACASPLENIENALEEYPLTDAGSVEESLEYISLAQEQVDGFKETELQYLKERVEKREADKDSFYMAMELLRFD